MRLPETIIRNDMLFKRMNEGGCAVYIAPPALKNPYCRQCKTSFSTAEQLDEHFKLVLLGLKIFVDLEDSWGCFDFERGFSCFSAHTELFASTVPLVCLKKLPICQVFKFESNLT